MDYLYKKKLKNEIVMPVEVKTELPATIVTHTIPKPESEPEVKQLGHITFISQEEYLRDIESMCKRDKWFMETIKGFCDKAVEVNVVESVQSDESTRVNEEGSE